MLLFYFRETTKDTTQAAEIIKVPNEVQKQDVKSHPTTHKQRLRALLAPLPRHIVGPVPTFSSEEEETPETPEGPSSQFSCPVGIRRAGRGRSWRAYPDPGSCR